MRGSTPNTAILQQHREKRVCPQSGTTCTTLASEGGDDADRSGGRERSSERNEWSALAAPCLCVRPRACVLPLSSLSLSRVRPFRPPPAPTAGILYDRAYQTDAAPAPPALAEQRSFFLLLLTRARLLLCAHARTRTQQCIAPPHRGQLPFQPLQIHPQSPPSLSLCCSLLLPMPLPSPSLSVLLFRPLSSSSLPMPPPLSLFLLLFLFLFPYPLSTLCCRRPSRPSRPP